MFVLRPLSKEMIAALGTTKRFIERYHELRLLSQHQSLIDNQTASQFVDDVIRRYKSIAATNPQLTELEVKKNSYLPQLRQLVAEISIVSFSKPGDVTTRLQEVEFPSDTIDNIVKGLEQAGSNDDDFCAIFLATSASSETSLLLCDHANHHHHHDSHHHHHGSHHHHHHC